MIHVVWVASLLSSPGCLVLKSQHRELVVQVNKLQEQQANQSKQLEETLAKATSQMAEVEEQLQRASRLSGESQATIGVRVENLEMQNAEVRGLAEDGLNQQTALAQNIFEMRSELEERLFQLEKSNDAAAAIPEGKQALLKEAENAHRKEEFKRARKLFRVFLSRYPNDRKEAEVRFKIGLTLYSESDDRSALGEFHWVISNKTESKVIPDALYYSGLAWYRLHNCDNAAAYFDAVINDKKSSDRYQSAAKKQKKTLEADVQKICEDPNATGTRSGRPEGTPTP